jgi:alkylation response protein AidB-like acyl-CoA dehydrogenase
LIDLVRILIVSSASMTQVDHPGKRLPGDILRTLSAYSRDADKLADLHPRQRELLHDQRWFRMFIPKSLGGLGLSLPEAVRLEETLAWADGSTAWVATLCAGAGWFVGFVDPSIVTEFFTGDRICIAGSGSATGTADATADGYLINGEWPFASGALHATAFTANCVIRQNGNVMLNDERDPLILPFVLKPSEVAVNRTWNTVGMVATASHSFRITEVNVPAERCFRIDPLFAKINDPIYRFPFRQLAETTLVANVAGMTIRFLDLVADASRAHGSAEANDVCAHAAREHLGILNGVRRLFFLHLDEAWQQLTDERISENRLEEVSEISSVLAKACHAAVDELYPLCRMATVAQQETYNLVWRNIRTASSHALLRKLVVAS